MLGELVAKSRDWSYNLEFEEDESYIIQETMKAINDTQSNHYVNIVTSEALAHPETWLIPKVKEMLDEQKIKIQDIVFVAHCGCGGFVTRIYK